MSNNSALSLTLALEKEEYILGEKVRARVILKNEGSETLLINKRLAWNSKSAPGQFREVNFVVTNPAGDELCFMLLINIGAPKDNDFTELYPGEAIEKSYEINRAYQLDTVGIYSVQAVYENQNDPEHGIMAWKGRLESNVVSFNVKAQ
jgi:hypothetical protein